MHTPQLILIVTLITALFAGCEKQESATMSEARAPATSQDSLRFEPAPAKPSTKNVAAQRMVIKSANLTIEHDAPESVGQAVLSVVKVNGGFVVDNKTRNFGESTQISITMRIPAASFETAVQEVRELGDVRSEAITGEDVTEEFMDLQAQLRNQRALESRFVELLGQAATVAETIEVERELARVRTEVERLEGRSQFLSDQVRMSTIALDIQPKASLGGTSTTIGKEVAEAFGDAGEIIAVVIGALIRLAAGFLPIGAGLAFLIYVFKAISRRRKRSQK